jgi:hypothetical protein
MSENMPKSDRLPHSILCFTDRQQMRAWVNAVQAAFSDTIAAGNDATRPVRERVLSRAEAKRQLCEAENSIKKLLRVAESALDVA